MPGIWIIFAETIETSMKAAEINNTLIDGYLRLLDNLSPGSKLDLISKLTSSVKADLTKRNKSFYKAFGAWDKKDPADILIDHIRESRTFNRQIEEI
jgi:hypothetical protein